MGRKKRKHFLGYAKDRGKPGIDSIAEVRDIVKAVLDDYRAGYISRTQAGKILGALKTAVKKSGLDPSRKAAALAVISDALSKDLKK